MTTSGDSSSPLLYFLAGTLVPSLAWFFLRPTTNKPGTAAESEEDEDEDTADATTGGPSSKWGYTDAPYKVSISYAVKRC